MPVHIHVPIRLHADPSGLTEGNAGAIGHALAAAVRRALNNSRLHVLEKAGGPLQARFAPPTVRWTGERSGEVGAAARFAIERALNAAVSHAIGLSGLKALARPAPLPRSRAVGERFDQTRFDPVSGTYTVPSYNNPPRPCDGHHRPLPVQKKDADRGWRLLVSANFRITPAHYFDVYDQTDTNSIDERRAWHAEVLDIPHIATAWLIEVLQESDMQGLGDRIYAVFNTGRAPSQKVYGIWGFGRLRRDLAKVAEDHALETQVPDFTSTGYLHYRETTPGVDPQEVLVPGAWLLLVFLPLPRVVLEDVVTFDDERNTTLSLKDMAGAIPEDDFGEAMTVIWSQALQYAGDSRCNVLVEKFTVRRKIPEQTLALLFSRKKWGGIARLLPLTDEALAPLAPGIRNFIQAMREDPSKVRPVPAIKGYWSAGARGVDVVAAFPDNLLMRVRGALNAALLTAEADKVAAMLKMSEGFMSAHRTDAFDDFIDRWEHKPGWLFELLLDELERRGLLSEFLETVRTLRGWVETIRRRDVLRLASQTKYARDPRVLALSATVERASESVLRHHYDVEAQEIWLEGDVNKRVRAAGNSSNSKLGVVAETDDFWSESGRVSQLGPEIMERLSQPTRKKIGDMMSRMICAQGETLTREEMVAKALQEAAAELKPPPEEKDFIKVTLQQSVRVLKVEHRLEDGVTETYVTFQEVRRFGDGEWEAAAEPRELLAFAFEARLNVYLVKHEIDLLGTLFLAETVLFGGVVVIEIGVSIGTLLVFVGLRLLIYRFTTDAEDRSLDGYLCEALKGEIEAVSFKFLAGSAKWAAQQFAGQLLTRELIGKVAAKWVVFALRGSITAAGFGVMSVGEQFAKDLLRLGNCEKWSGSEVYWDKFKTGFIIGVTMEFVAIPLLAPPARALLERAGSAYDAARALFTSGKTLPELEGALLDAGTEVEDALARTIDEEAIVGPLRAKYRSRLFQVLAALGREYEARAYASVLDLYGPELSSVGARGLRRLLSVTSEREVDALMQRLLSGKVAPMPLLNALGGLDETVLTQLARSGNLEILAASPRLLAWLTRDASAASVALLGPFNGSTARLEAYLGKLEALTPNARASVLGALSIAHPLPPEFLLGAAREIGALDAPTLDLLKRSVDSGVPVGRLFDGTGSSLRAYVEDLGKLFRPEQDYALQLARGRPPNSVLAEAAKTQANLKTAAAEIDPTPDQLQAELAAGTRTKSRASAIRKLRDGGTYETAILDTVLQRQARQLAAVRKELLAFSPDAVLGVERSGPFIAKSAAGGEQSLSSRIISIARPTPGGRTATVALAEMRARVESMIAQGKRRFAFAEAMMGGGSVNKLQNDVMIPLARSHPEAQFRGFYLREGLNNEGRAVASGSEALQTPAELPNMQSKAFDVPFIVGDDAPRIIEATGAEPVYIFNREGHIVETLQPKPGETTLDMMIRILTERGGG